MGIKSRAVYVPEFAQGVCVWEVDGAYLSDGEGFLSLEGIVGDRRIEEKMEKAARYWMESDFSGKPKWLRGSRQISADEYEEQKGRLIDGKIPDPVEEAILAMKKNNET